jgi:hypothetical protein
MPQERRRAHDEHPVEQLVPEAVVRHPGEVVDRPLLLVGRKEPAEGLILDRHNAHGASQAHVSCELEPGATRLSRGIWKLWITTVPCG